MEGAGKVSLDNPDSGMIPRAVQQIYSACEALKGSLSKFDFRKGMGVYNGSSVFGNL